MSSAPSSASDQLIRDAKNLNVGSYDQTQGKIVYKDSQGKELAGPRSWIIKIMTMNPVSLYFLLLKIFITVSLVSSTIYYIRKHKDSIKLNLPDFTGFIAMFILFMIVFYTFWFYSFPTLLGMS
jgi:hypothetical protein